MCQVDICKFNIIKQAEETPEDSIPFPKVEKKRDDLHSLETFLKKKS